MLNVAKSPKEKTRTMLQPIERDGLEQFSPYNDLRIQKKLVGYYHLNHYH